MRIAPPAFRIVGLTCKPPFSKIQYGAVHKLRHAEGGEGGGGGGGVSASVTMYTLRIHQYGIMCDEGGGGGGGGGGVHNGQK